MKCLPRPTGSNTLVKAAKLGGECNAQGAPNLLTGGPGPPCPGASAAYVAHGFLLAPHLALVVYLLPFLRYLAGSKSISVRRPTQII